jgi:integrase
LVCPGKRGCFAKPGEPTFVDAAAEYIAATGNERFIKKLAEHFGFTFLRKIKQKEIDEAAIVLYPTATAATRNRQIHTIVSAILKHAEIDRPLKRPKGSCGNKRTVWLRKEEAFALFKAADARDAEFGIFIRALCYTGLRLSEATGLLIKNVDLQTAFAYVPTTKNGTPRGVHLPPVIVAALANHPRGLDRGEESVFRFRKCGRLYMWLDAAFQTAGLTVPARTGFHILRHTWATWMRQYGGLDTRGLVGTGAWTDQQSAARYEHVVATEEARRADLLPTEPPKNRAKSVEKPKNARKACKINAR